MQGIVRYQFADQTDLVSALSAHALLHPHQRNPQDLAQWHSPCHADRLKRCDQAKIHMGVEKRCVLGGDHDISPSDHVERATCAHTADRANHRFPNLVVFRIQAFTRVWLVPDVVGVVEALDAVQPRGECAVAVSTENHGMNVVIITHYLPQALDFQHHLGIDGIELVSAVERDRGDVIVTHIELH